MKYILSHITLILFLSNNLLFAQNDATNDGLALTLQSGLTFTMSGAYTNQTNGGNLGTITNAGTITLTGNWTNNSANDVFVSSTGKVSFIGTAAQTINGTNSTSFDVLELNNTAGLTLSRATTVEDQLILTDGKITATALITLNSGATSNVGSGTSYVVGTMRKLGNQDFTFPIGDATYWAPIGVSNFTAGDATTAFDASYSFTRPASSTIKTGALKKVSWVEGWDLAQPAGTAPTVQVTLHWKDQTRSGTAITGSAVATDLVVAHWNGSAWESVGQGAHSDGATGYVTSNAVSSFSPFSFGSLTVDTENDIALPIELLNFSAVKGKGINTINWTTSAEINNDYFVVEISADGVNFEELERVNGKGSFTGLSEYQLNDENPFEPITYYRLKQVDFDGTAFYSKIVSIESSGNELAELSLNPNPVNQNAPYFFIGMTGVKEGKQILVVVKDVSGKEYYSKVFVVERQSDFIFTIDPEQKLSPGIYLVSASVDNSLYNKKLIVR